MQPFPHYYPVQATATADSQITLSTPGADVIHSAGPVEFGGPGHLWSPESLLVAAVADCFILSFKAAARAARFDWTQLEVSTTGKLDRIDKITKFVAFDIRAMLEVPHTARIEQAQKLLHQAEKYCLITNSMTAERNLTIEIAVNQI